MKKVIMLAVFLFLLTGCGQKPTEISEVETVSSFIQTKEAIGEYTYAEYEKYNSYARDNGLGDTKIYIDGTVTKTELYKGAIYAVLETDENKEWSLDFGLDSVFDFNNIKKIEGKKVRAFCNYNGFSDTFKMPALTFIKASVVDTGEVFSLVESLGANDYNSLVSKIGGMFDDMLEKDGKVITDKVMSAESPAPQTVPEAPQIKEDVPAEYKSALKKAESYSNTMNMSKAKLYDQLTSEYGEKFSKEAAQYAIENVKADWKSNALATAKKYQSTLNMSPSKIKDQLTSAHGEKFTSEEAEYAIQHLND